MNSSELGKRIKEARLAKKLTQSEVAGTFITRNMLSQIESGSANPSLKTLEYLTSVLDIPIAVLMPDKNREENNDCAEMRVLADCKACFADKDYAGVVKMSEELMETLLADEAYAITARSYMNMALELEKEGNLSLAASYASKAYEMSDKGIYASKDIQTFSLLLMNRIAEKIGK